MGAWLWDHVFKIFFSRAVVLAGIRLDFSKFSCFFRARVVYPEIDQIASATLGNVPSKPSDFRERVIFAAVCRVFARVISWVCS